MKIEWKDRKPGDLLRHTNVTLYVASLNEHVETLDGELTTTVWNSANSPDTCLEVLYRRPDPEPEWPGSITHPSSPWDRASSSWDGTVYPDGSVIVSHPETAITSAKDARLIAAGWLQVAVWLEWKQNQ